MIELLRDIKAYLNLPHLVSIPRRADRPWLLLFRLALIALVAGISGGMLSGLLVQSGLIPSPGPSVLDKQNISQTAFFFGAVVMAPLIEESIFRAQLRRFSASLLFISFMFGVVLMAITKTDWAFLLTPFIFILLFTVYRFTLAGSITRKFRFWTRLFPWYFHFTAICFALVHLGNFEKGVSLLPLGILYTLPQLAIGLVLGYARMNYGLKYSIALHALYNLSLMSLLLFRS
jgi:membrane protease YdiL (CAAX protease family)